jgi:hypothetical protein
MALRKPTFFPARVNMYVPSMSYAADAVYGSPNQINFGTPLAAAVVYGPTAALTTGVAAAFTALGVTLDTNWGRGCSIVASAASTRTFILRGRDYLGQPMYFSGSLNGATPVDIPKAFKYLDQLNLGASADVVTVSVSSSAKLGTPYKTTAVLAWFETGAIATAGTLTNPDLTTPATGTTTDPRGLLSFNGALNGTKQLDAVCMFDFTNLHGVQHFYA